MRLRAAGILLGLTLVCLVASSAIAEADVVSHGPPTTTATTTTVPSPSKGQKVTGTVSVNTGTIGATAGNGESGDHDDASGLQSVGVQVGQTARPVCDYLDATFQRSGFSRSGLFEYRYIDQHFFRYRPSTGEAWIRMRYVCTDATGRTTTDYVWVGKADPDPRLLSESAFEQIKDKTVLVPVPALSPSSRGYVNLGMWLAIDEPRENPVSVTATAGNVSATTTAVLRQTLFDMGTGDPPIVCDGVGDPIPDDMLDSPEPSPVCGFTYVSTNDGVPYEVTVTAVWDVSWTSNIGLGGNLGVLERSTTVPYEVLQIQTVGGYSD